MSEPTIYDLIKKYALNKDVVSDSEIISLVKKAQPTFNDKYRNILIKDLRDKNIIYSYDTNLYKAYRNRKRFIPSRNEKLERNIASIKGKNDLLISCFDSSFFNELSSLQSVKTYIYIGIESYAINYIIDRIDKSGKQAITSNDLAKLRKMFNDINCDFDFVIKTINIDTPLLKEGPICYPKLETILVDLFVDKSLNDIYSSEVEEIYTNALKQYAIKINTLLRYADKKGAKNKMLDFFHYIGYDIAKGEFYG